MRDDRYLPGEGIAVRIKTHADDPPSLAKMSAELVKGLKANVQSSKGAFLACALAPLVLVPFVEVGDVRQEFYAVLATTIPILLFALLVRHQAQRELILKTLDRIEELETNIAALREEAHPDDVSTLAKIGEFSSRQSRSDKEIRKLAPRALAEIVTSFFFAAAGMVGCLTALATGGSNYFTFYLPVLAMLFISHALASSEIGTYKVYFGERGLLPLKQSNDTRKSTVGDTGSKII